MAIALFGFNCDQARCQGGFEDLHCRGNFIYGCGEDGNDVQDVVLPHEESLAAVDNSAFHDIFGRSQRKDQLIQLRERFVMQRRQKFEDILDHCCHQSPDDPVDISRRHEAYFSPRHPQQTDKVRPFSHPQQTDAIRLRRAKPVEPPVCRAILQTPPLARCPSLSCEGPPATIGNCNFEIADTEQESWVVNAPSVSVPSVSLHEPSAGENENAVDFHSSMRSPPEPKAQTSKANPTTGNLDLQRRDNNVDIQRTNDKKDENKGPIFKGPKDPLRLDKVVVTRNIAELNLQNRDAACEDEEEWGEGAIRVLVVCGDDATESNPRGLLDQLQRWCNLCKIDEVDTVLLPNAAPGASRLLADALTAIGAKSQSGDVCVLLLAELTSTHLLMNDMHLLASSHFFLSTLPPNLTVVCISDSSSTLEAVGLGASTLATSWHANLRAIVMSVAFEESEKRRGQLLVDALEHTKSALSLSEGPCGLTCADFFEELTDQACDIAAKAALAKPILSMYAHPSEQLPSIVRWPVAALPRYGARKRSARSRSASRTADSIHCELSDAQLGKFFNIAKVIAITEAMPEDVVTAADFQKEQMQPKSSQKSASKSKKQNRTKSREVREKLREVRKDASVNSRKSRSSSNTPANIDQFSAMFSGGLLSKAQRENRNNVA